MNIKAAPMKLEMNSLMKKYTAIFALVLCAMLPVQMNATHIVGGDMSFKCLGNDFYEVTLTLRRDCINGAEDAPFDEQAAVGIFDKTGKKLDFLGRLGILYMPFMGADTIQNNVPDCALEGDLVCVSEAVYTAQVYLPFREVGYVLTYQRCCRNGTLNNIVSPLESGATRTVCISAESQMECNSGPAFGEFPPIIACANEELVIDASATDINGDSLVYRLVRPYTGASLDYPKPQPPWNPPYDDFIEYLTGFDGENPLGDGSTISLDTNTGMITVNAVNLGQFLVGIEVEEFRNGESLSVTNRDFELNVRDCGPYPRVAFEVEDNCAGLTINVTNNTVGGTTFAWNFNYPSTDDIFQSTEENPGSFTYPEPGIYNVRLEVTDAEGICVLDEIKEVRALNSQLTSSFDYSNGCCSDGSTELSLVATSEEPSELYEIATYEYQVTLNGGDPFSLTGAVQNIVVSCTDEVVVTLITTSTSGCMASATETIVINPDLGLEDGLICMEELTICLGQTATLGPLDSERTYSWTPDSSDFIDLTDPFNPIFTPSDTTTYTVVATDANGAKSTGTVIVNVVGSFDLAIDDVEDVECATEVELNATSNRDDLTYEWSLTDDFENIEATGNPATLSLMTGTNVFYVKATSPEGCEEVSLTFIESSLLSLEEVISDYNACSDASATVTINNLADDQDVTITWDDSPNFVEGTDLSSNVVQVVALSDEDSIALTYTASNDSDCSEERMVTVPVMRSISGSVTGTTMSCDGNFSILANSDAEGATFEWSYNSDFDPVLSTDASLDLTLTGDTTIYMRASVGEVCRSEVIITDLVIRTFEVAIENVPAEMCVGDEAKITGTSDDATVTFVFGPSENIVSDDGDNMVTIGVISGQSEVTVPYVATNDVGCEVTGEVTVPVGTTEQPEITVMNIDCSNGDVMFKSGRPDGTVTWDFGDGGTSTDGDPTHTYSSGGTYTVTLSSNADFCKFTTVTLMPDLIVPDLFSFEPITDTDVRYCGDDAVTFAVAITGNASVAWEDGNGNSLGSGPEITVNPMGEYDTVKAIATADDTLCGMSMIEFTLSRYVFDYTVSEIPDVICPGEAFELSITNNTDAELTYEWSPASVVQGSNTESTATIIVEADTDVVVRITNPEFMCSEEVVFPIDVPELDLTAEADPDPNIFLCDEVVITANPSDYSSYQWSNGVSGATQSVAPTETTTYTVTATDANGCTTTASVTINVEIPPCTTESIFIPEAFSPNGDGNNDLLLVRSNAIKEMDFYIVDRWGNEVFRTTDQRDGWNGKFRNDGRDLHPDAYAWCLFAICSNGDEMHFVGNVTLLR